MKTILVPTDFSKEAEKGYAIAASIAKAFKTNICVLNITKSHINDLVSHWNGTSLINNMASYAAMDSVEQEEVNDQLNTIAKRKEFEGISVTTKTSMSYNNDFVAELIEEINHTDYGLIVMGTAGDQQEGESFAEVVARHSMTPVLTSKALLQGFDPKNIVLCTDFESITMGFLQRIKTLKEKFNGTLKLLYINTPKHFKTTKQIEVSAKNMARKFILGDYKLFVYNANDVKSGIKEFVEREATDLLALSTHGRTGALHYFYGSNTEDLINECNIPIYSYNLHEYLKNYTSGGTIYTRGFTG